MSNLQCSLVCRDQMLQQPNMFLRHQITCFLPVVTCFQCICECTNCSNRICMHTVVFPSVTGNCTAQHTFVWVFWAQPHCCWKFLKGYTSNASAEFVQVQHVTNHSMLGFNQHKMIKSHVVNPSVVKNQWLSALIGFHFCGAIGGSQVVMSSLMTRPVITVLTGDWPQTLVLIATYMLHKRVSSCLLTCPQL